MYYANTQTHDDCLHASHKAPGTLQLDSHRQRHGCARQRSPPVAVEVVQLLLHIAAEAASVVSVQPLAHDAHPILALVFVKRKVLDLRGDAPTEAWVGLVLPFGRCLGRHGNVAPGGQ